MDFEFTEDDRAFGRRFADLLDEKLPADWQGFFAEDREALAFTREFCRDLGRDGLLTVSWPREYGGQEAGLWKQTLLRELMTASGEPRGPQYMNLNYIGPLIMKFGTAAQKARFLPPMARGEVIWTQGFSEPDAGSDLAALRTRAVDHGDHFVVTGQKIWSSYADSPADWNLLLVRTNPDAGRRRGMSVLLVDMTSPGITVRPIESMGGWHEINEVFYDEVRVPRDCLLGPLDEGWGVIGSGLTLERIGIPRYARAQRVVERLCDHVRETGRAGEPDVRQKLADLRVRCEAAKLLAYRAISLVATGANPAAEASTARIHATLLEQAVGQVGLEILGASGRLGSPAEDHAPLHGLVKQQWVHNIPATIGAGTLEIQKNIVAQTALGLPRSR
ncbi:acyl-CoA dehydrogenase family protein [Frankia sp. AiPs1]|uniref:acyl-CoA dehydrogenase family protein n=1 Tax=Frankia sp. AiPs1 TaxID=573493 RepID=UPI002042EBF8|nr:acyl-CoA dehydrogenase family protein [Frankia sp. AiPs1]MCM3920586.1 acyl-CoA dehydrogenase family protein [Frankia sp. AiPs1]